MRIIILVFCLMINSSAMAISIPADFLYQDKIIDPNCILASNTAHTMNLKECSQHQGKRITNYILEDGFIGYNYINLENDYPGAITYKYLGKIDDLHLVHAFIIGGSVARLNYINYFKVNGDTLKLIKRGPAGDRSLGGIFAAKIANNSLTYDMALTAKLFIINFGQQQEEKAYLEQLPDCAVCQFARVHYLNNKVISVTLNAEIGTYQQTPIAQCFNNIHQDYIDKKRLNLTPKEAKELVKQFISKCTIK